MTAYERQLISTYEQQLMTTYEQQIMNTYSDYNHEINLAEAKEQETPYSYVSSYNIHPPLQKDIKTV